MFWDKSSLGNFLFSKVFKITSDQTTQLDKALSYSPLGSCNRCYIFGILSVDISKLPNTQIFPGSLRQVINVIFTKFLHPSIPSTSEVQWSRISVGELRAGEAALYMWRVLSNVHGNQHQRHALGSHPWTERAISKVTKQLLSVLPLQGILIW